MNFHSDQDFMFFFFFLVISFVQETLDKKVHVALRDIWSSGSMNTSLKWCFFPLSNFIDVSRFSASLITNFSNKQYVL